MSDYEELIIASQDEDIKGIPTGLPNLDRLTGCGGFPIGRITILTGPYSTGKSSLALFTTAQAQKLGMETVWVDTEMTFDKEHSAMCGVDNSKLKLMRQTAYAEKVLDTIELYLAGDGDKVKPHKNALVVLDSYSGLSIMDEVQKSASGADFGAKSKMIARFFRKIKTPIKMNSSALIVMTHQYPRMGAPGMVLAGGDSMAKSPSLWIDLYKKGTYLKSGEDRVGEVIVASMKKNKVGGKKYAECDLQFVFGQGWNPQADLIQDALDKGIITREGNTFFFSGQKIGMKTKLAEWVKENTALLKEALTKET